MYISFGLVTITSLYISSFVFTTPAIINTVNAEGTTSEILRFSANSTNFPGTKIAGSITPKVSGSDLTITGDITYIKTNTATAANVANAGRVSFHLIDGTGATSQIEIKQLGIDGSLEYDIPYSFSVTFPNYNKFIDQDGNVINQTIRKTPFTLRIVEDQLSARAEPLTVVSTSSSSSTPNSGTGTADSSTGYAANGTKVTFSLDHANYNDNTNYLDVKGYVDYNKIVTAGQNMVLDLYDTNDRKFTNSPGLTTTLVNSKRLQVVFQGTTTEFPIYAVINDKTLFVSSKKFDITGSGGSSAISQNGGYASPQTDTQTAPSGTAKGTKVNIAVTNATLTTNTDPNYGNQGGYTSSVVVGGTVSYTGVPTGFATDPSKIGNVKGTLYDKSGNPIKNDTFDLVTSSIDVTQPIGFSFSFSPVDISKAPFTFKLAETNLGVTSKTFPVVDSTNQNQSNQDPNTSTNNQEQSSNESGKRTKFGNPLPEGLDTIPEIVSAIVKGIVIPIAVPLLGLSIIYTGFLFVQARGNETKLTEAKNALKWTLIGGAIILAAYVIAEALQATINDIIK